MEARRRAGLFGGLLLALALTLGGIGIGYVAYTAGVRDGATQVVGREPSVEPEQLAPPYYPGLRPYGAPGAFLLACLVLPFAFFLFFGAMKLMFAPWRMGWGRGWSWGRHGRAPERWRERMEQIHREFHEAQDAPGESPVVQA